MLVLYRNIVGPHLVQPYPITRMFGISPAVASGPGQLNVFITRTTSGQLHVLLPAADN